MAQMFSPWFLAALFAGRLLLVTVFAVAGVAKLRDRDATWAMLRAFGANVRASDVVLLKASRGVRLEKALTVLAEKPQ